MALTQRSRLHRKSKKSEEFRLDDEPLWYKDAIIYQLHVRAFCDGNGDGIGDFNGLTEKLDYLQDLGVTVLWLLPFNPSPLRDDGYDISDYTNVHPNYGTVGDFKEFLREAHRRSLRVITELVINHTSDQHPLFQKARQAEPGSRERNYYVWSDTPERYQESRIIFKDFEPSNWAWDPVAKAYYWHRFYSHQPDLNFDNPEVKKEVFSWVDFWMGMGVDGMRLDAVPYLYEREGTNCENLPETHAFLKELRRYIDSNYKNRMLLAEANQWPEDAVTYFGEGDECHMAFHFPVMPRLFMAIHMEDRFPIFDILDQTPEIPENSQWALFLRNHDELTLEMVTDEDRDYMYKVYANDPQARINLGIRRRLATLLGNNRRKIELMNSLLFSLPGTPVIYYGDEIGMGDNIYLGDRNGVRTPMQWSADRNAGFSRANPQRLFLPVIIDPEYHYEALNVEAQQRNLHLLLWWMKRLILLRKRHQAFGRGSIEFLYPENKRVLVFIRRLDEEMILVVANLSRFVQYVELDLSTFEGMVPMELFGQTDFPPIGQLPYFLTLGPHTFYWFKLEPPRALEITTRDGPGELPLLQLSGPWNRELDETTRLGLEDQLVSHLKTCRWFAGKARPVRSVKILDTIPIPFDGTRAWLNTLEVQYGDGRPETYLLPLAFATGEQVVRMSPNICNTAVVRVQVKDGKKDSEGILYDAFFHDGFCQSLLDIISRRRSIKGKSGELVASHSRAFRKVRGSEDTVLQSSLLKAEQSNTSIIYGNRLILKMFRGLQEGMNPELEIGRFNAERNSFHHIPPLAGALEYRDNQGELVTLGILQGLVSNQGDAWQYTMECLARYFEDALTRQQVEVASILLPREELLDWVEKEIPPLAQEIIGSYLSSARLLGQRTGELHVALASDQEDPAFAPEPFSAFDRRSLYQSMRTLADQELILLGNRLNGLLDEAQADAKTVLGLKNAIFSRLHSLLDTQFTSTRIRCHGDYHLGQLLYTGKDFVIIDFEGEPSRSVNERRMKRSPLRDVAGMLRSFNYASIAKLKSGGFRSGDMPDLETWARFWYFWVSVGFLQSYFHATSKLLNFSESREEIKTLLDIYLLEKAIYELGYELNHRPDWVHVPLQGILEMVSPVS